MSRLPGKFVKRSMKTFSQKFLNRLGYKVVKAYDPIMDKDERFKRIYHRCRPFTHSSKERMYALYKAVEYIVNSKIPGDLVECGVWRGGNPMVIGCTLMEMNDTTRKIYLYDTFEGMPEPTQEEYKISGDGSAAISKWKRRKKEDHADWWFSPLSEVQNNLFSIGYPKEKILFVKGKVEETIPKTVPSKIALLRLDTDWYESTKHELSHLFPVVSKNGVLIIDDYGTWSGSKRAVDEYFSEGSILLNRIDHTGTIGIKIK